MSVFQPCLRFKCWHALLADVVQARGYARFALNGSLSLLVGQHWGAVRSQFDSAVVRGAAHPHTIAESVAQLSAGVSTVHPLAKMQ
eukprot:1179628-Alexandrium_andersonii.AAC.2